MADLPQFDDPALDGQLGRYYEDLDVLVAAALAGEVDERTFMEEMERIVAAMLMLMFFLGGGSMAVPGAQQVVDQHLGEHRRSIRKLADDVYSGRYSAGELQDAEEGREKVRNRLALWAGAAAAVYREGQVHRPARVVAGGGERRERRLQWQLGNTETHCSTCSALHGVVLTASEWRRVGVAPQAIGDGKECGGWRCDCRWVEVEAESVGIENVPVA